MPEIYYFEVPTLTWIIVGLLAAVIVLVFILVLSPMLTCRLVINPPCASLKIMTSPSMKFCVEEVKGIRLVDKLPKELEPTVRLWGIGLPGFKWGWFRLHNGAKAFIAVAGRPTKYIIVELKDGRYIILAPKEPEKVFVKLAEMGMRIEWR